MLAKFSVPARLRTRKLRLAGIGILAALATLASGPVAAATPDDTSKSNAGYLIVARHSSKCMDVQGASTADAAPIIQWRCHGYPNQRWTFREVGDNRWLVISDNSGKCLDVPWGSQDPGVQLIQYRCHGGTNQQFSFYDAGDGWLYIRSVSSGQCVDVQGGSTADGAPVIQWPCHGGYNQQWAITG